MTYTYDQILDKVTNLRRMAEAPEPGETSGCFSSFDRHSHYNEATNLYENWGANADGDGCIRTEGENIVALELEGPGVIWRSWSADAQNGHIRIFIDGAKKPVIDMPFKNYFERFHGEDGQFWPANFPQLMPTLSRGRNRFIPICFLKSCKITLSPGWGMFYHFTYTRFPKGTQVPSYSASLEHTAQIRLAQLDRTLALRGQLHKPYDWSGAECAPNQSTVLYENTTAGAITSFSLEIPTSETVPIGDLFLEMYWDGHAQPAVNCPVANFFAAVPEAADYRCLPVSKVRGRYQCEWHMPHNGVKILLNNKSNQAVTVRTGMLEEPLDAEKACSLMRFYAQTHGDDFTGLDPARFNEGGDRWPDWPLLRCNGLGRLCGVHLEVDNRWPEPKEKASEWWYGVGEHKLIDWWWGEGDEKIFVDHETFPSTFGTGSEDYIGYAWAAEPPFSLFDSAFACQNSVPLNGNGIHSVARFHLGDNIPFRESLEAFIEKYKPNKWDNGRAVCQYRATCFYYLYGQ